MPTRKIKQFIVNMGIGTAIKMLSLAADLPAQLRPSASLLTRLQQKVAAGKLEDVEEEEFALRIARYHAIVNAHPQDAAFLRGWLNRVAAARTAAHDAVLAAEKEAKATDTKEKVA